MRNGRGRGPKEAALAFLTADQLIKSATKLRQIELGLGFYLRRACGEDFQVQLQCVQSESTTILCDRSCKHDSSALDSLPSGQKSGAIL